MWRVVVRCMATGEVVCERGYETGAAAGLYAEWMTDLGYVVYVSSPSEV